MEYYYFRTIGKYTFCISWVREASRTQHAKKNVFFIPLTTCILLIAKKIDLRFLRFLILSFQVETRGNCASFFCTHMPPLRWKTGCSLRGLR